MRTLVATTLAAGLVVSAPVVGADPGNDPGQWPVVDNSGYTSATDPGWVFFRAYSEDGPGCAISPTGTVGCDIVVPREPDGSPVQIGTSAPAGSYACNPPGEQRYSCPLPPPGANQVLADPQQPARYAESATPTFTRDVAVLPAGYRLVNGAAWCSVSPASPGGITCRSGDNGFQWSSWGGILAGL